MVPAFPLSGAVRHCPPLVLFDNLPPLERWGLGGGRKRAQHALGSPLHLHPAWALFACAFTRAVEVFPHINIRMCACPVLSSLPCAP